MEDGDIINSHKGTNIEVVFIWMGPACPSGEENDAENPERRVCCHERTRRNNWELAKIAETVGGSIMGEQSSRVTGKAKV